MSEKQAPLIAEPTVVSLVDARLGHDLVSILRTPRLELIVSITGRAKKHYGLPDEDWHWLMEQGYDIWTRTFASEGELAEYTREHLT